jgi:hypothetical protein
MKVKMLLDTKSLEIIVINNLVDEFFKYDGLIFKSIKARSLASKNPYNWVTMELENIPSITEAVKNKCERYSKKNISELILIIVILGDYLNNDFLKTELKQSCKDYLFKSLYIMQLNEKKHSKTAVIWG